MKTEYAKLKSLYAKLDNQLKKEALESKAAEKKPGKGKKNEHKTEEKAAEN